MNPADLLAAARKISTELSRGAAWADGGFAHEDLSTVELRVGDLLKAGHGQQPSEEAGEPIVVRSPTLLETTAVFPPDAAGAPPYFADADQILRRVRRHTCIGTLQPLNDRLRTAGDPTRAPFGVLGLPPATTPEKLHPYLRCARVAGKGMNVVVADLTATSRRSLTEDWEKPFATLLASLDAFQGRRPPVVAVTEDGHAFTAARRVLRVHASMLSPKRAPPLSSAHTCRRPA